MAHGIRNTNTALMGSMILGLLFSGCPGDSSSPDQHTDGSGAGTFTLRLVSPVAASGSSSASEGYTAISGKVFSGPVPEEVVWDVDAEQGGCKLLKPRVPFCDPSCGSDVCVEDDTCQASPKATSVGTVTLSGLEDSSGKSADLKIEPIAASYSTPADVSLAYPPFDEGAELKLNAKGGDASGFEIVSHGIAPLSLTTSSFALKSGSAFALAWTAASKSDVSRIQVKLDISHHGGTKGKIECDVADSGSLSIAADLITRLLKLGVAGFPSVVVDRVNRGTTTTAAGSVEFKVVSELEQPVQIDGLTSCSDSADCAQGETCQADLTCK